MEGLHDGVHDPRNQPAHEEARAPHQYPTAGPTGKHLLYDPWRQRKGATPDDSASVVCQVGTTITGTGGTGARTLQHVFTTKHPGVFPASAPYKNPSNPVRQNMLAPCWMDARHLWLHQEKSPDRSPSELCRQSLHSDGQPTRSLSRELERS